jgi:hypothetical protein
MRKLAAAFVPLLMLACGQDPSAPQLPQLSASRTSIEVIGPFEVTAEVFGSCTGFDILSDYTVGLRHNIHYDKAGAVAREEWIAHWIGEMRLYNSAHPELELFAGPGTVQNSHWDHVHGWVVSALSMRIVVPGFGPIEMETGVWKIDIATWTLYHDSGWNFLWEGDFAALCKALTP